MLKDVDCASTTVRKKDAVVKAKQADVCSLSPCKFSAGCRYPVSLLTVLFSLLLKLHLIKKAAQELNMQRMT